MPIFIDIEDGSSLPPGAYVERIEGVVQNESGTRIAGADVRIVDHKTGVLAALFADEDGTPLANPLSTDNLGRYAAYVSDGAYQAQVYMGGILKGQEFHRIENPDDGLASLRSPSGASMIGFLPTPTISSTTMQAALAELATNPPKATTTTPGAVVIGEGLALDEDGKLRATGLLQGSVGTVNGIGPDESADVVINTTNVPEGGRLYFTAERVLATALTGLSTASGAVAAATDTVLAAIGKLQRQISDLGTSKQNASAKDASGGFAGLTGFAINLKNAAGTIVSQLVSAATAARTYTFPDKDGTVAMMSDLPSPALVLLGSATVSTPVAAIDFPSIFTSSCDRYIVEIQGLSVSAAASLQFWFAKNGVVETTGNSFIGANAHAATSSSFASTYLSVTNSMTAGASNRASLTLDIRNVNDTSAGNARTIGVRGSFSTSSGIQSHIAEGLYSAGGGALSGFRLAPGTGNINAGTVRVYGMRNA
ncbi:MAG: hypothetical protein K0S54_1129 [Alphaproteobacteria bacterium]|jgi:hypothetical protein|nr:hypothetical protein [Alphaproteobacteria bacterium]